jgi:peptidoglycan/xylan/chitin deacetylase (PgdA/CDA1 family)
MSLAWSEANYRRLLPHNLGSRAGRATGTGGNTWRYGRRSTGMRARTDRHLESQRERDRVFALPDLAYESTTRQKKDAQTLTSMPERIVVAALGIVSVKSLFSVCLAQRMGRPLIRLAPERVSSVPILMYHRIAADGPVALERFRVAPKLFALQMATLHRAGYRTIGLGDWIRAMAQHKPLLGKPVILTFDDGYRDFLTAAMPTLRVHGFSATVFLVADRIGGTAHWDAGYGEPARLLSWEEVRALQEAGIEFGCHSSLHRPMTGMRRTELVEDTMRARAILEEGLAIPIRTLAYPYGAENEFVRRVIKRLGFRAAVSCGPGISQLGDNPLRLPRIEVPGGCTPERLLASLNHASSAGTPSATMLRI